MPTYEYHCPDCGQDFEAIQKITEAALTECPKCKGQHVKRLISATAFHLKGSGWYKTDYGSSGSSSSSSTSSSSGTSSAASSSASDSPAKEKSGTETKSESKSESSSASKSSATKD